MKLSGGGIRLAPTDLANYAACPHLTTLDLAAARGEIVASGAFSAVTDALRRRGEAHESAYVESLRAAGLTVVDLRDVSLDDEAATRAAMADGVDRIVQAPLLQDGWAGRADVLVKVARPSALGDWSYEPLDTKLARETRGSALLQLCAYASALEGLQRAAPAFAHVVIPGVPFVTRTYRLAEYSAYFRFVRGRLLERVAAPAAAETYPDPVAHCDVCRWSTHCDARRRADDHLSLVAGMRRLQISQLTEWQVTTLAQLAHVPLPLQRPARGSAETLVRLREQARVQLEGRTRGAAVHEVLPVEPGTGLCRLPEPSSGDVFLDLEGDPFVPDAGREYLFGWACYDDQGNVAYERAWGLTPAEEKAAFERFVDFVVARLQRHPGLHVYHYAPYEPAALKRLMGRFATREDEVDDLLRGECFVDLYAVVRHAVRASVERYSIKSLEVFYGYKRRMPLADAGVHLRTIETALEFNELAGVAPDTLAAVEAYNRDDCLSALELRDWLERLRTAAVAGGTPVPRPPAPRARDNEELTARETRVRALMATLTADVPVETAARTPGQQGRWLLAQMLEFHRREDKADWWEFYRLAELPPEDYADEPAAVAGLEFQATVCGGTQLCPVHRYTYPAQELSAPEGEVHASKDVKLGSVYACDPRARHLDVKKRKDSVDVHPPRAFFFHHVRAAPIPDALFAIASGAARGIPEDGSFGAAADLLLRRPPRLRDARWRIEGEDLVRRARRLALVLDRTVLPVQGPPGAGKTYLGAQMICALVAAGRRVGITANSHKVIRNLLDTVQDVAKAERLAVRCIQKVGDDPGVDQGPIVETDSNEEALERITRGEAHVVAGTVWMWSRDDFQGAVDVLFVDEAGQMALANVIAASRAADSLVLLGDPQQLEQPLQGSHPEGTAVSALQHILGEHKTMPSDRGLFLPETWRMAPALARFTSEAFYDGRLSSRAGLDIQRLICPSGFNGSGLWFVPVPHAGNQNESPEEVAAVAALVEHLRQEHRWVNQRGVEAAVDWNDILIVAPYNAQVSAIRERLPQARAGTVDRFQGQEAAIVIYSATTSAPEDAPRGMEFLYSLNRLNVATSRARCAGIVVASPRLLEADCQTPRQMQLANALCRYVELASSTTPSAAARNR